MNPIALSVGPLLLLFTLLNPSGPEREGPPRPPPEAIQACEGMDSGEACAFTGRQGETLSGTCFTPASDKPLACRPDNAPPPPV